MPKTHIIGNWKMNQSLSDIEAFFETLKKNNLGKGNFGIAPMSIHLPLALSVNSQGVSLGAQNCSEHEFGAFTGELHAQSLKELGASFVLIGHSERRALFGETNQTVNQKTLKSLETGLTPVVCVGETLEEREAGKTLDIVLEQVEKALESVELTSAEQLIIAYEPVWAIGTGKTATAAQAQEVHAQIRTLLEKKYENLGTDIAILYGGSVKPANVKELLAQKDINGGLVGGASLKAESFLELCQATI